jgi:glutaredoxin-like protein NrdH
MQKKVTVYTKYGCPQCDMTKRVLDGEGIEFTAINVQDDEKAMEYVKDVLGLSSMPVVIIEGEEPFTGFRPDKLQDIKE